MGQHVRLPIEKADPSKIDPQAMLGIVTAVAEQGTYTLVWDFLKALPKVENTSAFLLDSMGMYSGGIVGPVKSILKKKGFKALVAKEIKMPNIFYKKRKTPDKDIHIREKGLLHIHRFARDVISGKKHWFDIPVYSYLMSLISKSHILKDFYQKIIPVTFKDSKCIRCDVCVQLCPVNHLTRVNNDIPQGIGRSCIHCQRCYSYCPTEAISIGSEKNIPYRAFKTKEFLELIK